MSESGDGAERFRHPHPSFPLSRTGPLLFQQRGALDGAAQVFVVDNEPTVRNLARSMLERLGWEVSTAAEATEAVENFRLSRIRPTSSEQSKIRDAAP